VPHYGSKVRVSVATGDALRSEMARISCRVGSMPETNPDCWMKGLLSTGIGSDPARPLSEWRVIRPESRVPGKGEAPNARI